MYDNKCGDKQRMRQEGQGRRWWGEGEWRIGKKRLLQVTGTHPLGGGDKGAFNCNGSSDVYLND